MKESDQIKAIAELEGHPMCQRIGGCLHEQGWISCCCDDGSCYGQEPYPDYLHSLDAIVPVIRKQPIEIRDAIALWLLRIYEGWLFEREPSQLSEALLRVTGKWIEETKEEK